MDASLYKMRGHSGSRFKYHTQGCGPWWRCYLYIC